MTIGTQLKAHLKESDDWSKLQTSIQGVNVVKLPKSKTRDAVLYIEINPLNNEGKPIKRKGLFVANETMITQFSEILNDERIYKLAKELEKVNPNSTTTTNTTKNVLKI